MIRTLVFDRQVMARFRAFPILNTLCAVAAMLYAVSVLCLAQQAGDAGLVLRLGGPIAEVDQGSPAAQAGLRVGDVITSIQGVPTPTPRDRMDVLSRVAPGDTLSLVVRRGGASLHFLAPTTHSVDL